MALIRAGGPNLGALVPMWAPLLRGLIGACGPNHLALVALWVHVVRPHWGMWAQPLGLIQACSPNCRASTMHASPSTGPRLLHLGSLRGRRLGQGTRTKGAGQPIF